MSGGASRLRAAALELLALLLLELAVMAELIARAQPDGVSGQIQVPTVYDEPTEGVGGEEGAQNG